MNTDSFFFSFNKLITCTFIYYSYFSYQINYIFATFKNKHFYTISTSLAALKSHCCIFNSIFFSYFTKLQKTSKLFINSLIFFLISCTHWSIWQITSRIRQRHVCNFCDLNDTRYYPISSKFQPVFLIKHVHPFTVMSRGKSFFFLKLVISTETTQIDQWNSLMNFRKYFEFVDLTSCIYFFSLAYI